VPEEVSLANNPKDLALPFTAPVPEIPPDEAEIVAAPVRLERVPTISEPFVVPIAAFVFVSLPAAWWLAEAIGADTTAVITPATNATTAVVAVRLRSVVFDIIFLSLVRVRNFLNLARRPLDPLILILYGTHV
jgi:hypothetical protein